MALGVARLQATHCLRAEGDTFNKGSKTRQQSEGGNGREHLLSSRA